MVAADDLRMEPRGHRDVAEPPTVAIEHAPYRGDQRDGIELAVAGGVGKVGLPHPKPPDPVDVDLYELEGEEAAKIQSTPGSLGEVLASLEADHEFLLRGGVFTTDLLETWISYKRERELEPVALRPHPYEFHLYSDI